MKRMKNVLASQGTKDLNNMQMSAEDVLWLLRNIDELKFSNVTLQFTEDNNIDFIVGDYAYRFTPM